MCEDSAWLFVISAVSAMNTNGARKAMAATMSRLWFATASRKRRLRTAAGGFRLTSGCRRGGDRGAAHLAAPV